MNIVKETFKGAVTLRAYGEHALDEVYAEMHEALDDVHTAVHACIGADRWVAIRL